MLAMQTIAKSEFLCFVTKWADQSVERTVNTLEALLVVPQINACPNDLAIADVSPHSSFAVARAI